MIKNLCCKTIPTLQQCNQTDLQLITHYPRVFQLIGEVKWDSPSMPFFYPVSPQAHLQAELRLQTTHTGMGRFFCGLCCFFSLSGDAEVQGWDAVGAVWEGSGVLGGGLHHS